MGETVTPEVNYTSNGPFEPSGIQATFSGSTVFLTGGTGFLGKLLIEKLLRSCPDIKKLYVLARPKKNKSIAERLQDQFNDVVYDRLRKEHPDFIEKISVVEGDTGVIDLGINNQDRAKLVQEVEFIFHGAATVRFDETLKRATEINVRGAREMLKLARSCIKLRSYVHISTAYSNCVHKKIEEKLYDVPMSAETLIYLTENMDEDSLVKITSTVIGNYPNTYAYTKSIAEHLVWSYAKDLPVAMYRPAIVISTAKEPIPGWIDNIYGPTGALVGAALGVLRVMRVNGKLTADLVPADMTVNACIAIAWKVDRDFRIENTSKTPLIYNYVSSIQNPLIWNDFWKYVEEYGRKYAPKSAIWYSMMFLVKSKPLFTASFYLLHWLPGYIVDGVAVMLGKKPLLVNAYTKIAKFLEVISYFGLQDWQFTNSNIQTLYQELCDIDKKTFNFDMASFSWPEFFKTYVTGIRLYLIKEPLDTKESIKKQRILRLMHYTVCTLLFSGLIKLILITLRRFYMLYSLYKKKLKN